MNTEYFDAIGLIDELAHFSGGARERTARVDEIIVRLARFDDSVRVLNLQAEELVDPSEKESQMRKVEELRLKSRLAYRRLRDAQLDSRASGQKAWQTRRENLLRRKAEPEPLFAGRHESRDEDPLVSKSEDVTQTLRRVHQMAQGEVLRAELNLEELDTSTKTLRELEDKYSAVDVLLNGSKKLVKLLDEADRGDRRRMQMALGFLGLVLCWVLYRRLFKLPIKLFLWFVFRLFRLGSWAAKLYPDRPVHIMATATPEPTPTLSDILAPTESDDMIEIWDVVLTTAEFVLTTTTGTNLSI